MALLYTIFNKILQYLNYNNLSGHIPSSIGNLTNLKFLYLNNNKLNGTIPSTIGNLKNLEILILSDNKLEGEIPYSIGKLSKLEYLVLSNNKLNGYLPFSISELTKLDYLDLSNNENLAGKIYISGKASLSVCELTNTVICFTEKNSKCTYPETDYICNNCQPNSSLKDDYCTCNSGYNGVGYIKCRIDNTNNNGIGIDEECKIINSLLGENESYNCCNHQRITCEDNHITEIDLNSMEIYGTIPSSIGKLSNLETLYLDNNYLTGEIPSSIGDLSYLKYLSLIKNQLTGTIPSTICNLKNLLSLYLSENNLSGPIPSSIGKLTKLKNLVLSDNNLSGYIPLSLKELTNLEQLVLSNNPHLSGKISVNTFKNINYCFFEDTSLCYSKSEMNSECSYPNNNYDCTKCVANASLTNDVCYCKNGYTGVGYLKCTNSTIYEECKTISSLLGKDEFYDCCEHEDITCKDNQIIKINLHNDKLVGPIPSSIGKLSKLESLTLSSSNLYGTIPSEIGNLNNLIELFLYDNSLSGSIPSSIGKLKKLKKLSFSNNNLSGSIPSSISNLENLTELVLSYNKLSGSIPPSINNLNKLTKLILSNNNLSGEISFSFNNFSNLLELDLSSNKLSGEIPSSIGNLSNLKDLDLRYNEDLYGKISLNNNKNLRKCKLSDTNLCYLKEEVNSLCTYPKTNYDCTDCKPHASLIDDICQCNNDYIGIGYIKCTNENENNEENDDQSLLDIYEECKIINAIIGEEESYNCCESDVYDITCEDGHITKILIDSKSHINEIPSSIGKLIKLEYLLLRSNNFKGEIPSSIGNLNNLTFLELSYNNLSGDIPASIGNLSKVKEIFLYNNNLESIPSTIGNLSNLEYLDISNNNLSGEMPTSIGKLENLIYLSLDNNPNLSGNIYFKPKKDNPSCTYYNTSLCYSKSEKLSDCSYPETYYDCTKCEPNASLINGVCKCNNGYSGIGYIKCFNETIYEECKIINNLIGENNIYDCCKNDKITCNNNHITKIDLSNKKLSSIPSSFNKLTKLEYLNISNNTLIDNDLTYIMGIQSLTSLNISYSNLEWLPNTLFKLSHLNILDISNNLNLTAKIINFGNSISVCSLKNSTILCIQKDTCENISSNDYKLCNDKDISDVKNGLTSFIMESTTSIDSKIATNTNTNIEDINTLDLIITSSTAITSSTGSSMSSLTISPTDIISSTSYTDNIYSSTSFTIDIIPTSTTSPAHDTISSLTISSTTNITNEIISASPINIKTTTTETLTKIMTITEKCEPSTTTIFEKCNTSTLISTHTVTVTETKSKTTTVTVTEKCKVTQNPDCNYDTSKPNFYNYIIVSFIISLSYLVLLII
ncbi:L domain-like protein [Neocallimastix californiae]|uniref:L domain-like protein n=1 Tax=Neocallimastix californiae TaxID=1754190 RepID=A0A1Y2BSZ1_9FUNG|nr:L domain-like protein [Neocallimastix californiae]|eukprot:ORY37878.1 L domain-like protein [Neocallimastix californiae]